MSRNEFDRLGNAEKWLSGPYMDAFGSGHVEPYRPYRDCWGILSSGRRIRTNTAPEWKESVPNAK